MGLITSPGKFLTQPQYPAQIDRSTSIGNKLRFAVIGSNQPIDLCNGTKSGGAVGTVIPTPKGVAYLSPTTATTWARQIPDIDPVVSGNFTVNWYGYVRTNVQSTLLQSSDGSHGWQLYLAPNAVGSSWLYLYSLQAASGRALALTVPDNSLHSIALTWDDAAGNIEGFLDGKSLGTNWWIKDTTAQGAAQTLSMLDGSGGGSPQKLLTVQAYKGKLTNVEIAALANNPWMPFKAPDEEIWISAGGGVALASNASSLVTGSAALSVAIPVIGASVASATGQGTLSVALALAAAGATAVVGSATLNTFQAMASSAAANTTGQGTLGVAQAIAGSGLAIATGTGSLSLSIPINSAALANVIGSGTLNGSVALASSAVAGVSGSGTLSLSIALSAAAIANAIGSGNLGVSGLFESHAVASASGQGTLTQLIPISGASLSATNGSGSLTQLVPISASSVVLASGQGALHITVNINAAALAQAMGVGNLTLRLSLSGQGLAHAIGQATLSGIFRLVNPAYSIVGAALVRYVRGRSLIRSL